MSEIVNTMHSVMPEQPEEVIFRRDEEHAYGYILEVLTHGLYPEKSHVVREYIQNGYDAILELRRKRSQPDEGKIEIRVETPSIFIYDNGVGMDRTRINEYRYVGHSRKLTHQSVGFRGIGKLSGISVADQVIVTTSPLGYPERHRLIFNARSMLAKVEQLKAYGENISLNDLILEHTSLESEEEEENAHYTLVELHNIRRDSYDLLDTNKLCEYLCLTAPIDFHPDFPYGAQIDEDIRRYVQDYDTVPLYVNGERIFKPFLSNAKSYGKLFVYPDNDNNTNKPLAFCWYCENAEKGQFSDKKKRGFLYRVKNFAVGDNQLPRVTLWNASPERSFYFFGEIHVCDPGIVPSADRSNFEHNIERDRLYQQGANYISKSLNTMAGDSSDERRAREFILEAESTVRQIGQLADGKQIPEELRLPKTIALNTAVENVEKRLKNASEDWIERGQSVIQYGKVLIDTLNPTTNSNQYPPATYSIKNELKFNAQATWVYEQVIEVLRSELDSKEFERIILAIHDKLGKV